MTVRIRCVIPATVALTLALSACGKIDPSAWLPDQNKASEIAETPAQTTRASELEQIFAEPQFGDVYAAELTYFSAYDFGNTDPNDARYGLMRIVAVHPDRITLNTETNAWPHPRGAINEMRGDLAGIEWDEDEDIEIYRNELAHLVADKKILDARRMRGLE